MDILIDWLTASLWASGIALIIALYGSSQAFTEDRWFRSFFGLIIGRLTSAREHSNPLVALLRGFNFQIGGRDIVVPSVLISGAISLFCLIFMFSIYGLLICDPVYLSQKNTCLNVTYGDMLYLIASDPIFPSYIIVNIISDFLAIFLLINILRRFLDSRVRFAILLMLFISIYALVSAVCNVVFVLLGVGEFPIDMELALLFPFILIFNMLIKDPIRIIQRTFGTELDEQQSLDYMTRVINSFDVLEALREFAMVLFYSSLLFCAVTALFTTRWFLVLGNFVIRRLSSQIASDRDPRSFAARTMALIWSAFCLTLYML